MPCKPTAIVNRRGANVIAVRHKDSSNLILQPKTCCYCVGGYVGHLLPTYRKAYEYCGSASGTEIFPPQTCPTYISCGESHYFNWTTLREYKAIMSVCDPKSEEEAGFSSQSDSSYTSSSTTSEESGDSGEGSLSELSESSPTSDSTDSSESDSSDSSITTDDGIAYYPCPDVCCGYSDAPPYYSYSAIIGPQPKGLACNGNIPHRIDERFRCHRVLVFPKAYHDGCKYHFPEQPEILRYKKNSNSPLQYPFYFPICKNESGQVLHYRDYVSGANRQDIGIDSSEHARRVFLCRVAQGVYGGYANMMQEIPPYCPHTVIVEASVYYYFHSTYDFGPLNCPDPADCSPNGDEGYPIKNLLEKGWLDTKGYVYIVKDGCQEQS